MIVQNYIKKLLHFLRTNAQELIGIPVALFIFLCSSPVIRWFEPTAALWDVGILQNIAVIAIYILIANAFAKIGAKLNYRQFDFIFQKDLRPWVKPRFVLYLAYFSAFVLLATSL